MVFLHGIPTNHALWCLTIASLVPNVRALAPDLTGFGLSDLPSDADLSARGQAVDVLAFLDRRAVERFTVVAHDYGGLVACELLAQAPGRVDGLVFTNTSVRATDWSGATLNPFRLVALPVVGEVAFALARRWMLRLAFRPFVSEWDQLTDELLDAFWLPFERGFAETLLRLFRGRTVDLEAERRWRAALARFDGPVSIFWGERDPAFRVDRSDDLIRLMPQARRTMLHNSNHFVPVDRPRALARLIWQHLGGSERSG